MKQFTPDIQVVCSLNDKQGSYTCLRFIHALHTKWQKPMAFLVLLEYDFQPSNKNLKMNFGLHKYWVYS